MVIANAAMLAFTNTVGALARILLALVAILVAAVYLSWSLGGMNIILLGAGLLTMPLAEGHSKIATPIISLAGDAENFYNNIADIGTDCVTCVEPMGELWNTLVSTLLGVLYACGEALGLSLPQWEQFRSFRGDGMHAAQQFVFLNQTFDSELERLGDSPAALALVSRMRLIQIRLMRTIDPRGERLALQPLLEIVCDVMVKALKPLVNIWLVVEEFLLMATDLIIQLVGPVFTDGDITAVEVFVKIIIKVLISLIDVCKCFDGFPKNFPRSIMKCACFWVYKRDSDVPSSPINAVMGCVCPGFNLNGGFDGIVRACFRIDEMQWLLDVVEALVDAVLAVIDGIKTAIKAIKKLINKAVNFIKDIKKFFKKKRYVRCGADNEDTCVLSIEETALGDFFRIERYNNATGEHIRTTRDPFDFEKDLEETLMDPRHDVDAGVDRIFEEWGLIKRALRDVREVQAIHAEMVDRMSRAMENAERVRRAEAAMEGDWERALSRGILRDLPKLTCPLPIDIDDDDDSRDIHADTWIGRARSLDNYFMSGLADRLQYALVRTVAEMHNASYEIRTENDDMATIVKTVRDLLGYAIHAFGTKFVPPQQHAENLRALNLSNSLDAVDRVATDIRRFHGWAEDFEMKAALGVTAVMCPHKLSRLFSEQYEKETGNASIARMQRGLEWLETQVSNLEGAKQSLRDGDHANAARLLGYEIFFSRLGNFRDAFNANVPQARFVGVGIIFGIAAGGVITLSLGIVVGLAVVAFPVIAVLLGALILITFALLGVFVEIGMTCFETMIHGGQPSGFDPVASLIFLIGPIVSDAYTKNSPSLDEIKDIMSKTFDLLLDDLEHIAIMLVRIVLRILIPFVSPPPASFDPVSGASIMSFVEWIMGIITAKPFNYCTISAGSMYADCFGECSCPVGNGYTRASTFEEPCQPGHGQCITYPFYRMGRFVKALDIVPGTESDCAALGYTDHGLMSFTEESTTSRMKNWWKNFMATNRLLLGVLAAGWAIPWVALSVYPFQSVCPCIRPFSRKLTRLTLYTQLLKQVYPAAAAAWVTVAHDGRHLPVIGAYLVDTIPYFTPQHFTWDTGYCAALHVGPWMASLGNLMTLLIIVTVSIPLLLPGVWLFLTGVVLLFANVCVWLAAVYASERTFSPSKSIMLARNKPLIDGNLPDKVVSALFGKRF